MKLVIVSAGNFFSDYGGGQVYVKNLVDALVDRGVLPIIATTGDPSSPVGHYRGCAVHTVSRSWSTIHEDEASAFLRETKPDMIHAHGAKRVFAETCHALGLPCVVTAHHGGILCPAGSLLNHRDRICRVPASHGDCLPCVLKNVRAGICFWWFMKMIPLEHRLLMGRILSRAKTFVPYITPVGTASVAIQGKINDWKVIAERARMLIAPSKAMAESMMRNGVPASRVRVINHGIVPPDSRVAAAGRKTPGSPDECIRFFYVGRISYFKGLHVLLAAFSGVGGNAELHILGGAGNKPEDRYMRRLKRKFQKNKRVIWHGKVKKERVYQEIANFDVMVHPAIYLEVFGLTIAEALALGKPVVATRCGGSEEQVEDGVNGFLVEPNDPAGLRLAMQRFADDHPLIVKMGEKGPGPVVSMRKHAGDIVGVYRRLLEA